MRMFHAPDPRIAACILGCCLLAAASTLALCPGKPRPAKPAVGTPVPPAQIYGKLLSGMEQEFVSAAEAMPEDKYDFAPPVALGEFKGVRTFGQQIKHVAESNYYFFGGPNYSEAEDKAKSDAIEKLTTKADIVKALKDSFVAAHAYIGWNHPGKRLCANRAWHARGRWPHSASPTSWITTDRWSFICA